MHDEPLLGDSVNAVEATKDIWNGMTFGGLVCSLRVSDVISQVDLARKIGVLKQFLNDVEHDRKDVGIAFAKKVSDALGDSIEPFDQRSITPPTS